MTAGILHALGLSQQGGHPATSINKGNPKADRSYQVIKNSIQSTGHMWHAHRTHTHPKPREDDFVLKWVIQLFPKMEPGNLFLGNSANHEMETAMACHSTVPGRAKMPADGQAFSHASSVGWLSSVLPQPLSPDQKSKKCQHQCHSNLF